MLKDQGQLGEAEELARDAVRRSCRPARTRAGGSLPCAAGGRLRACVCARADTKNAKFLAGPIEAAKKAATKMK